MRKLAPRQAKGKLKIKSIFYACLAHRNCPFGRSKQLTERSLPLAIVNTPSGRPHHAIFRKSSPPTHYKQIRFYLRKSITLVFCTSQITSSAPNPYKTAICQARYIVLLHKLPKTPSHRPSLWLFVGHRRKNGLGG